jgi:hypothetical protein
MGKTYDTSTCTATRRKRIEGSPGVRVVSFAVKKYESQTPANFQFKVRVALLQLEFG